MASGASDAPSEPPSAPNLLIGAVAKTEWPALLGADVDAAIAEIERDRPDMLIVKATPEGATVSKDMACRRVRVWHGPDRRVTRVPCIG